MCNLVQNVKVFSKPHAFADQDYVYLIWNMSYLLKDTIRSLALLCEKCSGCSNNACC